MASTTGKKPVKGKVLGPGVQIGIVVKNTDKALEYYEKIMGLPHFISFVSTRQIGNQKSKIKISVSQVESTQFEVIEVLEGQTIHSQFVKQGHEGLHHIGFYVEDIESKLEEMRKRGVKVAESGIVSEVGVKYAYLDTASTCGIMFELIQLP